MHFEFYGSLLIIGLVAMRRLIGKTLHLLFTLGLLAVFTRHPMGLFVLGHLLAPLIASARWQHVTRSLWMTVPGCALLCAAMGVSMYDSWRWIDILNTQHGRLIDVPGGFDSFHIQSALEAVLIFCAVICAAPLQRLLSKPAAAWLGRISYSLYLTHFPIILTLSSAVFISAYGSLGASAIATGCGLLVSIPVALAFESLVDRPAIRLSRKLGAAPVHDRTAAAGAIAGESASASP